MKPSPMSPLEKISAATISVTTVLKTVPIPFQKLSSISMTLRKFRLYIITKNIEMISEKSMATVVLR